jgi:arsenate reductase
LAGTANDGTLGLPDPAEAKGNPAEISLAFKDNYRMLNQRISIFTSLPLRSLDQLSLQKKLREIGRMEVATVKVADPT